MDDLLKPNEEMLTALATELGLLSIVPPASKDEKGELPPAPANKNLSLT